MVSRAEYTQSRENTESKSPTQDNDGADPCKTCHGPLLDECFAHFLLSTPLIAEIQLQPSPLRHDPITKDGYHHCFLINPYAYLQSDSLSTHLPLSLD